MLPCLDCVWIERLQRTHAGAFVSLARVCRGCRVDAIADMHAILTCGGGEAATRCVGGGIPGTKCRGGADIAGGIGGAPPLDGGGPICGATGGIGGGVFVISCCILLSLSHTAKGQRSRAKSLRREMAKI